MAKYQTGVLTDGNPFVVNIGGQDLPLTATLTSALTGRLIRLSSTGTPGSFYNAIYDASTAAMLNVSITAPLRAIEFTGQAGDVWEIR